MRPIVIAEAGVNHNGDFGLACALADEAKKAGADVVKFQTFKSSRLVTKTISKAGYQVKNTESAESQYEMLRRLELSFGEFKRLKKYCDDIGIQFYSTAFDSESLNFLVSDLDLKSLKIPSGDLDNAPFVLEHARCGSNIILSTGMASVGEIEQALAVLAYGFTSRRSENPNLNDIFDAYYSDLGQEALKKKVTLLHCTTAYPTPCENVHLNVMSTLKHTFGLPVGLSDHSAGIAVPIAAAALGARVIEKHFTLDKSMEGPDHSASLDPAELREMILGINEAYLALGSTVKIMFADELANRDVARKCIVATKLIEHGDEFSAANIEIKRAGRGMAPIHYWDLLGKTAKRRYSPGQILNE